MSALAITFRCFRGEKGRERIVHEDVTPAMEYGTIEKIGRSLRINGELVTVEFEFSPCLVVEFSEEELSR